MSGQIKFALPSAAHVFFFAEVIMPQMQADKYFGLKRNYPFASWHNVEICVIEAGQAPGGYKDGVRYQLPQTDFNSYLANLTQLQRDQIINDVVAKMHAKGWPVTIKMVRDMTHVFSKAIRYLVQMNEDGTYTKLDGKPGHIPQLKAAQVDTKLAEMMEAAKKQQDELEKARAEIERLKATQPAPVEQPSEKPVQPAAELTEDDQIAAMLAEEAANA